MTPRPIEWVIRIGNRCAVFCSRIEAEDVIRNNSLDVFRISKDIYTDMYAGMPVQKSMERQTYWCKPPSNYDGRNLMDCYLRAVDRYGR